MQADEKAQRTRIEFGSRQTRTICIRPITVQEISWKIGAFACMAPVRMPVAQSTDRHHPSGLMTMVQDPSMLCL